MDEDISTQDINNILNLDQAPDTSGFDLKTGQTWIYPTNYPIRDYQYNITEKALFNNTLVSLPTGLGKTFIAAVVMYNFYRWYPSGKVIFMAPTKPLVKQQVDACYNIMAIPKEVTAELTGSNTNLVRTAIWRQKRVFFITPHVLQNDLGTVAELGPDIKCLVFDEAHKAKGNYAYCEVIRRIAPRSKLFRVLALSATPGNSVKDIIEVVTNLQISHLEFRAEDSPDVKPYAFERNLETVVVPLGPKLEQVRESYILVLEQYVRTLMKYNVIQGNCANFTKGRIFLIMKNFKSNAEATGRGPHYNEIMSTLNICVTLYHAFEVLVRHGLRGFLNFFDEHLSKSMLQGNQKIIDIMEDIRTYLGPEPQTESLPDGTVPQISPLTKFGHPKYYKLQEILMNYFETNKESKVIVFFEYRESVMEAYALLLQSKPMIKPRVFLGQKSGVTQKIQINIIKSFREGICNTLLSTSIGEEGLDVGEVDLIICFDISNKSPIRMIQRMGRTGRRREGQVVALVTSGREQETLKQCLIYKHNLGVFTANSTSLKEHLYKENPRMVPANVQPQCQKLFITVKKVEALPKKGVATIITDSKDIPQFDLVERLPKTEFFWNKSSLESEDGLDTINKINLGKFIEQQRNLQNSNLIRHSKDTELLADLLKFADSKRFNIPTTQIFSQAHPGKNLKQTDIRNLFAKQTNSTVSEIRREVVDNDENDLYEEIGNYLEIRQSILETCNLASPLFPCPLKICQNGDLNKKAENWIFPDFKAISAISVQDFDAFMLTLCPEVSLDLNFDDDDEFEAIVDDIQFDSTPQEPPEKQEVSVEKSFKFETPKSFSKILNQFPDISFTSQTVELSSKIQGLSDNNRVKSESVTIVPELKSIKNDEEAIVEAQLITAVDRSISVSKREPMAPDAILAFFKLDTLLDLFETPLNDSQKTVIVTPKSDRVVTKNCFSPDLFDDSLSPVQHQKKVLDPESPVISATQRLATLKSKRELFRASYQARNSPIKLQEPDLSAASVLQEPTVSLPPIVLPTEQKPAKKNFDISNLCDLSEFLNPFQELPTETNKNPRSSSQQSQISSITQASQNLLGIEDLVDLSQFNLSEFVANYSKVGSSQLTISQIMDQVPESSQTTPKKIRLDKAPSLDYFSDSIQKMTQIQNSNASTPKVTRPERAPTLDYFSDVTLKPTRTQNGNLTMASKIPKSVVLEKTPSDENFSDSIVGTRTTKKRRQSLLNTSNTSTATSDDDFNFFPSKSVAATLTRNKMPLSHRQTPQKLAAGPSLVKKQTAQKKVSVVNISLSSANSDDDFEEKTPIKVRPKSNFSLVDSKMPITKTRPSRKRLLNDYIDDEAEVSENDDENPASDDERDSEDLDCYDQSFIEDETVIHNTQVHAEYLKSIKSPVRGKFKIPTRFRHEISDVFSQAIPEEEIAENTYLDDSFCVDNEQEVAPSSQLSQLEVLEKKLKEMNRKKRRKKAQGPSTSKKKRIIVISDDSD